MAKVAFIGHSYHRKTKSFDFFFEILSDNFSVDLYFDESWSGAPPLNINEICISQYDVVILWQQINYFLHPDIHRHANVILVPMYDCHAQNLNEFKRFIGYDNIKFINFCRIQHETCEYFGLVSLYLKFYLDPGQYSPIRYFQNPFGYFWCRRKEINWNSIKQLISGNIFSGFILQNAPDKGFKPILPTEEERTKHNIILTGWHDSKDKFINLLSKANIYFSPRLYEGIGLSFLEAMAMGLCVVAPNKPTMNEYIIHNCNGLLYDPHNIRAINFDKFEDLGKRARLSIEMGYRHWVQSVEKTLDFMNVKQINSKFKPKVKYEKKEVSALLTSEAKEYLPLITVAMVTKNAGFQLSKTIESIISQTYKNIEIILVDGGSTDSTLQVVKKYEKFINIFISEPDNGPYDAMNKAAKYSNGIWILFLNAGDWFTANNILETIIGLPIQEADVVYGHHYYLNINGHNIWHKANEFSWTYKKLKKGLLSEEWVMGIPGHQATLTKTSVLRNIGYDQNSYQYAADHDFLFRLYQYGYNFFHTDLTISFYTSGGISWINRAQCMREQWLIALNFGPKRLINKFYKNRYRYLKKEQKLIPLKFSKEWYFQESMPHGSMRWLYSKGNIQIKINHSGFYLMWFLARSASETSLLKVKIDKQDFFETEISSRFRFLGPFKIWLNKQDNHTLTFFSRNEPIYLSQWDHRLVHLSVKNIVVIEDTVTNKIKSSCYKLYFDLTPNFLAGIKSRISLKKILILLKWYIIIYKSGLFSKTYYLNHISNCGSDKIKSPLWHFIRIGAYERKNPNRYFNTGFYLDQNPDVAASGVNPLYHYIVRGKKEGRVSTPRVFTAEYFEKYPGMEISKTDSLVRSSSTDNQIPKNITKQNLKHVIKKVQSNKQRHDIASENEKYLNNLKNKSDLNKVVFLNNRGKILEEFKKKEYLGGVYEQIIKAFYSFYLKKGDVAIDCGAEVGHHTFPLSNVIGSTGFVYAIDARPESIGLIKTRKGTNKNIIPINCALSNYEGKTIFTTVKNLPGWSSLVPYGKYPKEVIFHKHMVRVRCLDNIIDLNKKICFIKLDIEGGEYHALLGTRKIINKHRPVIIFENGGLGAANRYNYFIGDFIDFFKVNQYLLYDILGEPFTLEFLITQHNVNNFLAIPLEKKNKYVQIEKFLWRNALKYIPNLNSINRDLN